MELMERRLGRIVFGLVLTVGAIVLGAHSLMTMREPDATVPGWVIVLGTWGIAVGIAPVVAAALAARIPGSLRLRTASLVLPALGVALMVPLTIHMPIAIAIGGPRGFDIWCGLSVVFASAAHMVFAAFLAERVHAIASGKKPRSLAIVYGIAVLAGCIPGVVPAVFVALTGLPILATVFPAFDAIGESERAVPEVDVPFAIARIV